MTENVNVSVSESAPQSQNQSIPSSPVQNNNSAPVSQPTPERLLRQSEVNELVGGAKHASYEKGKQDALAEWQKQNQSVSSPQPNTPAAPITTANLSPEQKEALKKEIAGDIHQQMQQQQMVNQFALKMSSGGQKYNDFEKVVTPLQLQTIPHVVQLANGFENTADIMYDLGKNPSKVSNLMVLAQINPQLAYAEMQNLSDSIKKNQTAVANQKNVREPLSQLKSSNIGVDNGTRTISDIRRNQRYKV